MSLLLATQITAIATAVLAFFAILTAVAAVLAFREQSAEVRIQREELKRTAGDRRRAQASRVFIWQAVEPGEDAVRAYAMGPEAQDLTIEQWPNGNGNRQICVITTHVRNTSEQPVYEAAVRWRTGTADWTGRKQWQFLGPGDDANHSRFAASRSTPRRT